MADTIDPEELRVNELPPIPEGIDLGGESRAETGTRELDDEGTETTSPDPSHAASPRSEETSDRSVDETDLCTIPGIGPHRAEKLLGYGYASVEQIADSRPSDIGEATGIGEQLATVAVEGAREIVGYEQSTASRLASETGVEEDEFDAALAALAASGVPPSEASPVLRVLYGPSIVEIESVTGQQAYTAH
ncbi:helix-hairpin-helix domain-containing protein [Halosolutus halophilus]|uniref:helix-hairpin-helix domain-containing protein n=1 Tax=Halosolutus halophilus TaxID=1552990 RepID=UPI0022350AA5|nr:helix-hairpin-helix domain-containing protein [Halosolutus halophilus]